MAYETKDLEGALFVNEKRERDGQPHYRGKVVIDGVTWWLAGWKNEGKNGKPAWLKLKLSADEGGPRRAGGGDDAPF